MQNNVLINNLKPLGLHKFQCYLLSFSENLLSRYMELLDLKGFTTSRVAFCQDLAFYFCVSALITKSRFCFAKSLAPPAKDSLRSSFASGGLSRLRGSILTLRPRGLFLTDRVKPSLWQRLHQELSIASFLLRTGSFWRYNNCALNQNWACLVHYLKNDIKISVSHAVLELLWSKHARS